MQFESEFTLLWLSVTFYSTLEKELQGTLTFLWNLLDMFALLALGGGTLLPRDISQLPVNDSRVDILENAEQPQPPGG